MSTTKIKFCGMTRMDDVDVALSLGVDFIGLITVTGSPRYLTPDDARRLRRQIGSRAEVVLLTRNADTRLLHDLIDHVRPDILQFHGNEDEKTASSFQRRWWKAVPMGELTDRSQVTEFSSRFANAERLLFDSHGGSHAGGRGVPFDWSMIKGRTEPFILAGGLSPANITSALQTLEPWAVDVASGIEAAPGIKDPYAMSVFADAVRTASP